MRDKSAAIPTGDALALPRLSHFLSLFEYTGRAFALVLDTSRAITLWLGVLSVGGGAVAGGDRLRRQADRRRGGVAAQPAGGATRRLAGGRVLRVSCCSSWAWWCCSPPPSAGSTVCESLLRALLGQRVNEMILEKALTLALADFEDSEFYDRMTRARREASCAAAEPGRSARSAWCRTRSRSWSTARCCSQLSPWAVVVLAVAAVPVFVAETRFSGEAFRLFRWRAPEARKQNYLETLLAREDHAKEVKLFGLGPLFLERYRAIFEQLFGEDRALTLRRGAVGLRPRPAEHAGVLRRVRAGSCCARCRARSRSAT